MPTASERREAKLAKGREEKRRRLREKGETTWIGNGRNVRITTDDTDPAQTVRHYYLNGGVGLVAVEYEDTSDPDDCERKRWRVEPQGPARDLWIVKLGGGPIGTHDDRWKARSEIWSWLDGLIR